MTQVAPFSFTTEIQNLDAPTSNTTQIVRRSQGGSGYQKLRLMKEKVKQASQSLQQQVCTHHRAQKSLQEVTRKSLIKRLEFLKVYSNKKSKYQHRQMLQGKRRDDEHNDRRSVQLVRRRKLENQLHHILVQNQEEDHIYRLQSKNRQQKELLRRQLEMTSLRERSLQRHDLIRKGNTQFLIRKKNIQTSVSMRSKHNYYSKINHQLAMIKQYEDIMTEIENFATLQISSKNDDLSTMFKTLQPPHFITSQAQN